MHEIYEIILKYAITLKMTIVNLAYHYLYMFDDNYNALMIKNGIIIYDYGFNYRKKLAQIDLYFI